MVKQLVLKRVPAKVDRVGGIGSIMAGLACGWIGLDDRPHSSIWWVWAVFCVVLLLNGVAMLLHAQKTDRLTK